MGGSSERMGDTWEGIERVTGEKGGNTGEGKGRDGKIKGGMPLTINEEDETTPPQSPKNNNKNYRELGLYAFSNFLHYYNNLNASRTHGSGVFSLSKTNLFTA